MTKDEAKIKLRKEGYNVVDDNSVVTVLIAADASISKTVKEVEAKLKACGYEASFAVKQVADGSDIRAEEDKDDAPGDLEDTAIDQETEESEDTVDIASEDKDTEVTEASDKSADNADETDPDDHGYLDDEDSDMLLTEEAVQFSLDDFGLDF